MGEQPSAGDIVVIEHPYIYDRHIVARVEKVGKVMWEVSLLGRDGWASTSTRRKVVQWFTVEPGRDPAKLADQLRNATAQLASAQTQIKAQYIERVKRIASHLSPTGDV